MNVYERVHPMDWFGMKFDDEGKHHAKAQPSDHTHAEPCLVAGLSSNDIYSNGLPHPIPSTYNTCL